jgi:periplasmic divalent cation tolerance protein
MNDEMIVLVTVPSVEVGEQIAATLVGERLAACVNVVGPIRSIYQWCGETCRDEEHLLVIKSTQRRFAALEARVCAIHPYEVPEVVGVSISAGSAPYLAWIQSETS